MIRVLVVEDSPVVQEFLIHVLSSDPEIQVIGSAGDGEEAIEAVKRKKPDVITMDINMPKMGGLDATRRIMETNPTPIVIVSGTWDTGEVENTFRAMEAGALAGVQRPAGISHPDHEATAKELIQTLKLMSEIKVVTRHPRRREPVPVSEIKVESALTQVLVVAIGSSAGGPLALQFILSELPKNLPVPLLIVQHLPPGFIQGFADWLSASSGFPVHVASDGEYPLPGHAYVAPDEFHMVAEVDRIMLSRDKPENGLRPSVSYLFRSIARAYGQNAAGVLLTGMGKDGAGELKLMKDKGAITIAQDKGSSVVHGMPGEAIRLGAATHVLPLDNIATILTILVNKTEVEHESRNV